VLENLVHRVDRHRASLPDDGPLFYFLFLDREQFYTLFFSTELRQRFGERAYRRL
jgi:hypothetical protein